MDRRIAQASDEMQMNIIQSQTQYGNWKMRQMNTTRNSLVRMKFIEKNVS